MKSATPTPPLEIAFEATPEIFATDTAGAFSFPLLRGEDHYFETQGYDEMRFTFSLWHPSNQRVIDLDRAYVELRASFDPEAEHHLKIAEMEPVVPAYGGGESFDGRGTFSIERMEPRGEKPDLGMASPKAAVQNGQER